LVKNEDAYIKPWMDFHLGIGITRFIIYDNSDSDTLSTVLRDYIEKKQVVLISWVVPYFLPKSGISGQTTQQNHSIYAFHTSKYIGLFDIDEYINMQQHSTIHVFLEEMIRYYSIPTKQIGCFTIKNKMFYNPDNLPTDGTKFLNITNCDVITLDAREKNFVIPQNVKTFSVHRITDGKPMFLLDETHVFFNHYIYLNKLERGKNKTNNTDNSILRHIIGNDSDKELEVHNNLVDP
jgi:hypothetical protein